MRLRNKKYSNSPDTFRTDSITVYLIHAVTLSGMENQAKTNFYVECIRSILIFVRVVALVHRGIKKFKIF